MQCLVKLWLGSSNHPCTYPRSIWKPWQLWLFESMVSFLSPRQVLYGHIFPLHSFDPKTRSLRSCLFSSVWPQDKLTVVTFIFFFVTPKQINWGIYFLLCGVKTRKSSLLSCLSSVVPLDILVEILIIIFSLWRQDMIAVVMFSLFFVTPRQTQGGHNSPLLLSRTLHRSSSVLRERHDLKIRSCILSSL